jgi:protein-S-isoprenylcysteine O-methyltransferase Ste14
MNIVNQLFSIILPATVLVIVPLYIEKDFKIHSFFSLAFGLIFIIIGLILLVLTITSFIRIGKGTLAPWSPTKKLVVVGIYSYVRNPM